MKLKYLIPNIEGYSATTRNVVIPQIKNIFVDFCRSVKDPKQNFNSKVVYAEIMKRISDADEIYKKYMETEPLIGKKTGMFVSEVNIPTDTKNICISTNFNTEKMKLMKANIYDKRKSFNRPFLMTDTYMEVYRQMAKCQISMILKKYGVVHECQILCCLIRLCRDFTIEYLPIEERQSTYKTYHFEGGVASFLKEVYEEIMETDQSVYDKIYDNMNKKEKNYTTMVKKMQVKKIKPTCKEDLTKLFGGCTNKTEMARAIAKEYDMTERTAWRYMQKYGIDDNVVEAVKTAEVDNVPTITTEVPTEAETAEYEGNVVSDEVVVNNIGGIEPNTLMLLSQIDNLKEELRQEKEKFSLCDEERKRFFNERETLRNENYKWEILYNTYKEVIDNAMKGNAQPTQQTHTDEEYNKLEYAFNKQKANIGAVVEQLIPMAIEKRLQPIRESMNAKLEGLSDAEKVEKLMNDVELLRLKSELDAEIKKKANNWDTLQNNKADAEEGKWAAYPKHPLKREEILNGYLCKKADEERMTKEPTDYKSIARDIPTPIQ